MKNTEDLIWRSKASKRKEYIMLFAIRLMETIAVSLIPSVIGIIVVFFHPVSRAMRIMNFASFIAFAVLNIFFWMRYAKQRSNRVEFYLMNGIVYIIYVVISVLLFNNLGNLAYSVIFSNLRGFEGFRLSTKTSLIVSHTVIVCLMIACEIISRRYYEAKLKKLAENGADEIEMDMWGDKGPIKQNRDVEFLSVDEVYDEMENEKIREAQKIADIMESDDEPVWSTDMYKGRGEAISYSEPQNIDNDIQDGDYVFGSDEGELLWNKEIYKGKPPIESYDDESEDYFNLALQDDGEDEPLWDTAMSKGKGEGISDSATDEIDEETYYDVVSKDSEDIKGIWDLKMYQGRRQKRIKKKDVIRIMESDEVEQSELISQIEDYDIDNLWSTEFEKNKKKSESNSSEEFQNKVGNAFENYDSDNLWDSVKQGK